MLARLRRPRRCTDLFCVNVCLHASLKEFICPAKVSEEGFTIDSSRQRCVIYTRARIVRHAGILFDQVSKFKVQSLEKSLFIIVMIRLFLYMGSVMSFYLSCLTPWMLPPVSYCLERHQKIQKEQKVQPAHHYYRTHNKKLTALKIWSR